MVEPASIEEFHPDEERAGLDEEQDLKGQEGEDFCKVGGEFGGSSSCGPGLRSEVVGEPEVGGGESAGEEEETAGDLDDEAEETEEEDVVEWETAFVVWCEDDDVEECHDCEAETGGVEDQRD